MPKPMSTNTTYQVTAWNETPYDELDAAPKLTRARVKKRYVGVIEGEGTLDMLMMHRADGSAVFTGLERIRGRVDGRSGTFVAQHDGVFENGVAKVTWVVVSGSGTDQLGSLSERDRGGGHPPCPSLARLDPKGSLDSSWFRRAV